MRSKSVMVKRQAGLSKAGLESLFTVPAEVYKYLQTLQVGDDSLPLFTKSLQGSRSISKSRFSSMAFSHTQNSCCRTSRLLHRGDDRLATFGETMGRHTSCLLLMLSTCL